MLFDCLILNHALTHIEKNTTTFFCALQQKCGSFGFLFLFYRLFSLFTPQAPEVHNVRARFFAAPRPRTAFSARAAAGGGNS
jgi:hypothetical protein